MQEFDSKDDAHLKKNGLKMPIKLVGKDSFLSLLGTDHTEYEEYKKNQLSTVIF